MANPVINPITSIIAYGVGVYFDFQPAASNSPTSWVITGLPSGMTYNNVTGLCEGAPLNLGIYDVTFIAHNASGDSAPLVAPMIVARGPGIQDPVILLDYDLETALVTASSSSSSSAESSSSSSSPVIFGKTGDKLLIALGFVRDGSLVPQTVEMIKLALKEFEPENLVDLSDGSFRIVWTDDGPRYIFLVDLSPDAAPSILLVESGYEDDAGTQVDMVCEIRVTFLAQVLTGQPQSALPRASQNFTFRVARSLAT